MNHAKLVYLIRYKGHLLKEQGHLYTCHLNFYKVVALLQKITTFLFSVQGKKVLKEVGNFFTYLLQRMSRLSEGIHHLKVVGQKIRWEKKLLCIKAWRLQCAGKILWQRTRAWATARATFKRWDTSVRVSSTGTRAFQVGGWCCCSCCCCCCWWWWWWWWWFCYSQLVPNPVRWLGWLSACF